MSFSSLSKIKEKIPSLQILDISDYSSKVTDVTKFPAAETGKNSILTPSNKSNNENDTGEITTFNPNPKTCSTARINKRLYKINKGLDVLEPIADSEDEEMSGLNGLSGARRVYPTQIRKRVRDDDNTPFLQWRKKRTTVRREEIVSLKKDELGLKFEVSTEWCRRTGLVKPNREPKFFHSVFACTTPIDPIEHWVEFEYRGVKGGRSVDQKLEKALREGRNLNEGDKKKLFELIDLNNDAGKFDMQLVLQYSDEYSTNLENDTPDIVLQLVPKGDSPPLTTRRLQDLPSLSDTNNSSTQSDDSASTVTAPPILRHCPTPSTSDGTPSITARADDVVPFSPGTANPESTSMATSSGSKSPRRSVSFDPESPTIKTFERTPRRSVTFNLPLPTTFSANDDSDQSDADSVENRTTYTQVPLMSTGGRARVATIATRNLMDISSESEAESNETKKMELKRAETLAAAKDHKKQVQLRKKHPLRQSDDTDSEIEITDEVLIEKDKDPTLTENRRTQPSRPAKTNPIDRFGAVVDVSKCDKSWREAINMVANMSRKEIEAKV